ncbi:Zinc finger A20 and AN1 domain-containing stress-associated protein 6 [Hondaea fermentalgiana]|uniref:Zinc finger A20 and AN1 domain-containing stress-associated protein 6 n=1 Tax=Hondaea fermentalgiana TaxID=2315210 RepID=A0A2R5GT72_9STRA|nr:Zinc finger A20 and AN1 domain-containing stress-associated protein 6 [Hondaea fermentalgiana]|eukprot:GBG31853.1 Zinc finger A20 and AN1 domain-containing stress-associated protein 6 [Hondaea fermentalgiana]
MDLIERSGKRDRDVAQRLREVSRLYEQKRADLYENLQKEYLLKDCTFQPKLHRSCDFDAEPVPEIQICLEELDVEGQLGLMDQHSTATPSPAGLESPTLDDEGVPASLDVLESPDSVVSEESSFPSAPPLPKPSQADSVAPQDLVSDDKTMERSRTPSPTFREPATTDIKQSSSEEVQVEEKTALSSENDFAKPLNDEIRFGSDALVNDSPRHLRGPEPVLESCAAAQLAAEALIEFAHVCDDAEQHQDKADEEECKDSLAQQQTAPKRREKQEGGKSASESGGSNSDEDFVLGPAPKKYQHHDRTAFSGSGIDAAIENARRSGRMSTANNNSGQEASPCLEDSCSFHGSPSYAGYCSVCYKKKMSDKTLAASAAPAVTPAPAASTAPSEEKEAAAPKAEAKAPDTKAPEAPQPVADDKDGDVEMAGADGEEEEEVKERPVQKKKNRCWHCRKKIGLTGIECRCGYIFCGMHRYADQHSCDFDHAALARKHLADENQGAAAKKVEML